MVALDRLGRSLSGIVRTIETLTATGVQLRSLREGIDSTTAMGRFLTGIFGFLAVISSSPDDQVPDLGCNVADGVFDLAV